MPDSTDFKTMLDNQTLPVEFAGKQPIDMKTYYNLFGVNRVPGEPKDSLIFNPNSKHIIVAHNKNVSFAIKFLCLLSKGLQIRHFEKNSRAKKLITQGKNSITQQKN